MTVTGVAEVVDDPALKARYLAVHPYASLYADFGDFATWRIAPAAGILVGGFARAFRLKGSDLAPDAAAVAAILAAEPGILAHCNRDHPDALAAIAGSEGDWRMVTADVDGFDLALGERVVRFAWSAPVQDAGDVRRELVRLAQEARGGGVVRWSILSVISFLLNIVPEARRYPVERENLLSVCICGSISC